MRGPTSAYIIIFGLNNKGSKCFMYLRNFQYQLYIYMGKVNTLFHLPHKICEHGEFVSLCFALAG